MALRLKKSCLVVAVVHRALYQLRQLNLHLNSSERAHAPAYKDIMQFFGVRIVKSTQVRRRARKWKRADVPARKTNVPSNLPSERDITSYAKRSLIAMKNAGNIKTSHR
ncbi:hypothetical protein PI124_g8613 [Phytophthora idaei]|nr:hypothetical protein PI124_g8613 [Phytophthora idaei]